jgi:hypothetical protein
MELLAISSPTAAELGHICDLIQDAQRGDLTGLTSDAQRIRFERSINHPAVLGLRARHAVSYEQPPQNPMTLDEATQFVRSLADKWLDS